jgi:hypothetical protein
MIIVATQMPCRTELAASPFPSLEYAGMESFGFLIAKLILWYSGSHAFDEHTAAHSFSARAEPKNQHVRTLVDKNPMIADLAIGEDGQQIVYCEEGNASVYVRDLTKNRLVSKKTGLPGMTRSLAVAPKLGKIAIATGTGLGIWDTVENKLTFDRTPGYCLVARYSRNEKFLATTFDGSVALWDAKTGGHIRNFHEQLRLIELVNDIQFSPDDSLLASCYTDGFVNIYDLRTKERLTHKSFRDEQLQSVCFLPKPHLLLIGSTSKVFLWDYKDDKVIKSFRTGRVRSLCLADEANVVYVCAADGNLNESLTRICLKSLTAKVIPTARSVSKVNELPNGDLIVSYGLDLPSAEGWEEYGGIQVWPRMWVMGMCLRPLSIETKLARIQMGMTLAQVEDIFGGSGKLREAEVSCGLLHQTYEWRGPDGVAVVSIGPSGPDGPSLVNGTRLEMSSGLCPLDFRRGWFNWMNWEAGPRRK